MSPTPVSLWDSALTLLRVGCGGGDRVYSPPLESQLALGLQPLVATSVVSQAGPPKMLHSCICRWECCLHRARLHARNLTALDPPFWEESQAAPSPRGTEATWRSAVGPGSSLADATRSETSLTVSLLRTQHSREGTDAHIQFSPPPAPPPGGSRTYCTCYTETDTRGSPGTPAPLFQTRSQTPPHPLLRDHCQPLLSPMQSGLSSPLPYSGPRRPLPCPPRPGHLPARPHTRSSRHLACRKSGASVEAPRAGSSPPPGPGACESPGPPLRPDCVGWHHSRLPKPHAPQAPPSLRDQRLPVRPGLGDLRPPWGPGRPQQGLG